MLAIIFGLLLSISSHGHPYNDAQTSLAVSDTIKLSARNRSHPRDSIGRYLEVDRILILGNKLTRNTIILRELRLKKGDIVNEVDLPYILEKDEQKLFNLHLFHTVEMRVLDLANGKIDILIEVDERWYTFPIPIFQLSDRNFNEWWETYDHDLSRVNYGVKLYQYNLWGRNHTMTFLAQFGFQRRFQLLYRVPYINKKQKQGLVVEMDFIEAKNVADSTINHKLDFIKSPDVIRHTRGIGLTYTYRNNFYIYHSLKYEYRLTTIADTLYQLNPNYLDMRKRQEFDALTYEVNSDHRDVMAYPLKGYNFSLRFSQIGIGLRDDIQKTEGSVSFSAFGKLKKDFFISNLSYLYLSTPDNLPYYNYAAMGYGKTFVRGHEIYVIEGPRYFLNKTTFKKRIFNRAWEIENSIIPKFNYFPLAIYLKTYADFGYVQNYPVYTKNDVNTALSNKMLGGAGFGIDFVTAYDFVMRFEYTFNTQNESGLFFHIKKEF